NVRCPGESASVNASPEPQSAPVSPPPESAWKKYLGGLGVVGLLLLKFGAKFKVLIWPLLKALPILLKSGGSMLLMVAVYTGLWGWKYAVGFVILLFVHECGHLVVAKAFGLPVGAPVFIPFMGAFIALKEAPKNAWIEACVGIGGPLLGSAGAALCHGAGIAFGQPLLVALAWTGYWLNLFNLVPIGPLDGGRIATALSPWLWVPGLAIMGWLAWTRPYSFMIWLVLLFSLPRIVSLFRRRTDEEQRFYEVPPERRWAMAGMYFALVAALFYGMNTSESQLREVHDRGTVIAAVR
ncbi:MAG: site-2 protease family protein, partial [Verrucomicrobiae bacterium]|nr:site-2 protease family protein [Verrucomicrobiae bacterium]